MMSDAKACETSWSLLEAEMAGADVPDVVPVPVPVVDDPVEPAVWVLASPTGWLPPSSW